MTVTVAPRPRHHWASVLGTSAFLTRVLWHHTVVVNCISLMKNDWEHLFICLFALSISSLMTCLFRSFVRFLNWVVLFLLSLKIFEFWGH